MNPFNIKVLHLKGSAREIGRQHGEECRDVIRHYTEIRDEYLQKKLNIDRETYISMVFEKLGFYQAAIRYIPWVIEEIQGLSDGASLDEKDVFINQLLDESDWMFEKMGCQRSLIDASRCSVIGAFGSKANPAIIAQNADMGKSVDGYQMLNIIHNTETGMRMMLLTLPGIVGIYGVNQHGVGVCLNAMSTLMQKNINGLGTLFVARGILECQNFEDAMQFVKDVPHASGETYTIGGLGEVAALECSAHQVKRFFPFEGAEVVYHTNHALENDDLELTAEVLDDYPPEIQALVKRGIQNTEARFASLEKRLRYRDSDINVEDCKEILRASNSETLDRFLLKQDEPARI